MCTFSNENALMWTPTNHPSEDVRIASRQENRAAQDWAIGRKILDRASKSITWGALHYTGSTGQRRLGLTMGKWNASEPKLRRQLIVGIDVRVGSQIAKSEKPVIYLSLKTDEHQKKKQIKMHCCT